MGEEEMNKTEKLLNELSVKRMAIQKEINALEGTLGHDVYIPALKKLVGNCYHRKEGSFESYRQIIDCFVTKSGFFNFVCKEYRISDDLIPTIGLCVDSAYVNSAWHGKVPFYGFVEIEGIEFSKGMVKVQNLILNHAPIVKSLIKKWQ
jgi:hypothetical protein